ncbi:M3 family oligoendopeptidase [Vallitalea okinawensis]|uniref:M3 family oligoendopeptidase n=1 Tax=Vallitalea okinawensis TaxID=2078660 RepID=UPI000CFDDEBC|nr:M3 family oligoendopeptidase [Vallitalea okinawensis]
MKFVDYEYKRPQMDLIKADVEKLIVKFNEAESLEEQNKIIAEINDIRQTVDTMMDIAYIRNTIDTTDEFYDKENDYMDENSPIYEGLISKYYEALVNSKFKEELKEQWGQQLFDLAEAKLSVFSEAIIPDLQEENKLSSRYGKLLSSAKIMFEGEERNLSQMRPFMQSKDRDTRIAAQKAYIAFFEEHEAELDEIYDSMVKVRHSIAQKLGFKNFVEVGYRRMQRTDYRAEQVANYRKQVKDSLVPITTELRERQCKRLGYDHLYYYDEGLQFLSGNPTPKGDPDWIMNKGMKMYSELSEETKIFMEFMVEHDLFDVLSKKGKRGGGYCTYLPKYQSPFIFANFNGTAGDVDVLTHEAGHAFQVFSSRGYELPEYYWGTYEVSEIHSMSMEFLTYPWMEEFFVEDTDKYKFYHHADSILFIPYGVTVDEFQHWVYENPEATPTERKSMWREIEKKYLPHRDYADCDFLERGGFWFRQGHIFYDPFYYIDYTLAAICAIQFRNKAEENREKAWGDYMKLCKAGGTMSFIKLLDYVGLDNPFEDGCIKKAVEPVKAYLDTIDDSKF